MLRYSAICKHLTIVAFTNGNDHYLNDWIVCTPFEDAIITSLAVLTGHLFYANMPINHR